MRVELRLSLPLAAACLLALAPTCMSAQSTSALANPDISPSLVQLADQPATHTGFTFDRSLLQAARALLESNGMDEKRAAAALSSVSYENYHYPAPVNYSPDAMDSIRATYHAAGWKHLVNARDPHPAPSSVSSSVPSSEPPADFPPAVNKRERPATDLWLHVSGGDIDGLVVLTRGIRNVNVVQVACDLRPLDLIGLGGHFGIPKVDPSAVMVPSPDGR